MLIGFLGTPCSGKTTTASKLFAYLKDFGYPAEFICEYARHYIAEKRATQLATSNCESVVLNDEDQYNIWMGQFKNEALMQKGSGKNSIILTDSSILNTLIYMENKNFKDLLNKTKQLVNRYDILFYSGSVDRPILQDLNRIHSEEVSKYFVNKLDMLIEELGINNKIIKLYGTSDSRAGIATMAFLERYV